MKCLFSELKSENNLFSAWRHVRRSAQSSKNSEIRGQASEFEHKHHRNLRRIQRQLREGRFNFDKYVGVLKDKKAREKDGKAPRPIAIGTIQNRVVQRAILQVLQPRKISNASDPNSKYLPRVDPRIGGLNDVNSSQYGVGGLLAPYGGVKPAIQIVMRAMELGATHFFQSDIRAFFTCIPVAPVTSKILKETGCEKTAEIFSRALEVHLANEDELYGYARLFPTGGIGVAQGSSLSAFAGNVLLYDFDHELNKMGVTAVRYIDDIFLLSPSNSALDSAIKYAKDYLAQFRFSLYDPAPGSKKAAAGLCRDAFNFLGCTIQPQRCVPSKPSVDRLLTEVREELSTSKKAIAALIRGEDRFDHRFARSATIKRLGDKLYGWEKSFAFATDAQAFRHMDGKVADYVRSYENEIDRILRSAPAPIRMRAIGIPNTERLFILDRDDTPSCPISQR